MHLQTLHVVYITASLSGACATAGEASFATMSRESSLGEARASKAREQDERALDAASLDRGALIRAVLDRNRSVESARHAWRAALARYRQAGALEDPMLMGSFAPLSIGAAHTRFGFELGVSQRIPLGGKLDAQAELAIAEARAAESDYAETRSRLALVASQLFDDYFVAVRSLEIQAQHVALVSALEQNASAAYASGHASVQDTLQAQSELARLEYQSNVYETQRQVATAQINALLHRDPERALPPPPAAVPARDSDPEASPEKMLAQRPDIAAARARVRIADARRQVAEREYHPDLTLALNYNSMWDMPEHRFMAGVSLNLPLQRERRQAALDEAAAMRASAESDSQNMTDAARAELAVSARRISEAERAVTLFEQRIVPLARERIEAVRAGFISAQNSFSALIEAERALRSAELELLMARADLSKQRAALDRTLGHIPELNEEQP
ncbi:MAG TPA: TolC family protein [Polyangiales bacterium]|nr:TolC family protein [Polyangiales bacterium]